MSMKMLRFRNLSPRTHYPFLFVIPSVGMDLRPTYEHENISVRNLSPRTHYPFLFVIPSVGMGLRPTYEDANISVRNLSPRTHHPFLFVIPSEAEGSAVRPSQSGKPRLQLPFVTTPLCHPIST
jgi:hypothetical protein